VGTSTAAPAGVRVSVGQPARAARRDASDCFLQTVLRARRGRMPSRTRGAGAGAGLNGSKGAGAGVGSHPPGGGEELADVEDVEVARPARGGQGVVGLGREKDTLNGSDQRRGRCCGVGGTRVRWGNGSWGGRARHTSRKRRARTRRSSPALLPPGRAGQQALGGHGAQARG